jgi:hypothetical protein
MVEDYFPFEKEWFHLHLLITDKTTIYICGGEPLHRRVRHLMEFCISSKELIEQEKEKMVSTNL